MKLKEKFNDPTFLFTVLRALCVALAMLGVLLTGLLSAMCLSSLDAVAPLAAGACAAIVLVAVCCYVVLVLFFRMCGRIRSGASFTEQNARAFLGIALSLSVAGCVILVIDFAAFAWFGFYLFLPIVEVGIIAVAFFVVALLSKALSVLVRRAVVLQQESDLTI